MEFISDNIKWGANVVYSDGDGWKRLDHAIVPDSQMHVIELSIEKVKSERVGTPIAVLTGIDTAKGHLNLQISR